MIKRVCFLVALLGMLLMTGCATYTTLRPSFELSNQYFMEKTIDEFNLGQTVSSAIPAGSKVAFHSLEIDKASQIPLAALIEDQMIQSLLTKNYIVMERDNKGLSDIIQESNINGFQIDQSEKIAGNSIDKLLKTSLNSAEYLITYRLQECGISYEKKQPATYPESVIRKSFLRIHIRVYNARTGAIVLAKNQIAQITDEIPRVLIKDLVEFNYSGAATYSYPLQNIK